MNAFRALSVPFVFTGRRNENAVDLLGKDEKNGAVELRKRFAENLKHCRTQAGLTPGDLAARASMHPSEIGKLERAERTPRIDTLVKLAGSLSVPPSELLEGIVWEPSLTKLGQFRSAEPDES
jgi:ribosome-binding protein aMBF1 (putative translation factor)